jgi:hypothetical protein
VCDSQQAAFLKNSQYVRRQDMVVNPGKESYRWQKTRKLMDVSGGGGVLGFTEPTVTQIKVFFGVQQGMGIHGR